MMIILMIIVIISIMILIILILISQIIYFVLFYFEVSTARTTHNSKHMETFTWWCVDCSRPVSPPPPFINDPFSSMTLGSSRRDEVPAPNDASMIWLEELGPVDTQTTPAALNTTFCVNEPPTKLVPPTPPMDVPQEQPFFSEKRL